ncbi:hypothetical protein [Phormidesmis priestleyi]|uniref:hypothetical protein n=1 Tax=Phormidesmis priestleyi TaxID=268141 RepID=UPI000ADD3075|nr:hypothetical protein [Phormidesmis priestleyi]
MSGSALEMQNRRERWLKLEESSLSVKDGFAEVYGAIGWGRSRQKLSAAVKA